MIRSAIFSEDRTRRFELVRDFQIETRSIWGSVSGTVLFVMLNPSKADEQTDDPTVRKTIGFARRWGYGRVAIVNLCPIVSTDPRKLPAWNGSDVFNRAVIEQWTALADRVIAAWGSQPTGIARRIGLGQLIYSFRKAAGRVPLHCIGTTKLGVPLHPSRAKYTDRPEPFDPDSV